MKKFLLNVPSSLSLDLESSNGNIELDDSWIFVNQPACVSITQNKHSK